MAVGPSGSQVTTGGLTKGARITGDQRSSLAESFGARYAGGESIRSIAEDTGRSYGFVHGVLKESGTSLRGRGGATRGLRRGAVDELGQGADTTQPPASPARTKAKAIKEKAADKVDKVADKVKAKAVKDDKGKRKADTKKSVKKGKKG